MAKNKEKLKKILNNLSRPNMSDSFKSIEKEIQRIGDKVKEDVEIKTVETTKKKIREIRGQMESIFNSILNLKEELKKDEQDLNEVLNQKLSILESAIVEQKNANLKKLGLVNFEIDGLKADIQKISNKKIEIPDYKNQIKKLEDELKNLIFGLREGNEKNKEKINKRVDDVLSNSQKTIDGLNEEIKKLRRDTISIMANKGGGGNMNRQNYVNSTNPLTKYTDINWKNGTGIAITSSSNDATKQTDITITNSGVIAETDPLSLHLDQTTPQTIANGIPLMTTSVVGTGSEYQLVNKEYVDLAVSSLELTEYFYDNASDIGGIYYVMDETPDTAGTVVKSGLSAGDNQAMFNFATVSGSPGLDRLLAGVYDCHFHAYKSNVPAKTVVVYFELYKRTSGGAETLLSTSENSSALTTTSAEQSIHCVIATEETLNTTDRLVIKWYANVSGGGAAVNVTFDTGGTNNSHFSVRVNAVDLGNLFLKLDQTTAQTITASPILNWLTAGRMTYMDSSKKIVDSPHIITSSPFSLLDLQSSVETKGSAEFVGTGTVGASGTTVTGSGTLFLTEARIGWKIRTTAGSRTITAIATNTSLTVDSSFSQSAGRVVNFTPTPYVYRDNSNNVLSYYDLANDRHHLLKPLYPTQGLTGPSGVNTTSFGNDAWKVVSQNNNEGDGISVWYNNLTGYLGLGPNWIHGSNTIYISSNHANHDDGLEFQDNSGNSYIKGKSVGYWGSASNRKTFNVGMNSEGTALHNVQPTGTCSGTPDACSTFMSETPCNNQDGCSWGYLADSCTGTLVCANQGSQGACEAIGCTWSTTYCSIYNNDYANCALNSPPCSWECSSCSIWNEDETNCQSHSSGQTGCDNCTWNAGSPSDCYGSQTTNCAQWNNDQTNCELNGTYCNWNDPNCTDKGCDTWDSDESTCGSAGCSWTPAVPSSCTGTYTTGNCNGTLSESCTGSPSTSCSAMDERCGGSSNCGVFETQEACNVYYPTCWWDGMTCQNYSPCSELESQGQVVCEGAGCTWTGQTCTSYGNHGGDCTYQSAGYYCNGTPNACDTFTSSTPCTEQVGCSWAYGDAYWGDGNFMTTASFKMLNAITDAQAPNGSFFIGSEHSNKACFKNLSGNVVELY